MSQYNPEKFGVPSPIWFGEVEPEPYYIENEQNEKYNDKKDIPGWGSRYRVRITSQHSEKRSVISSKDLPMVGVSLPVTAGTGRAGSRQTSNLRQGDFVWGFFHDPVDCTEPFIAGCFPNNDQIDLKRFPTENAYDPISGWTIEGGAPVPDSLIPGVRQGPANEGGTKSSLHFTSLSDQGPPREPNTSLRVSSDCDRIQLGEIQLQIQKLIQDLEKFKQSLKGDWLETLRRPINENGQQYSIDEYVNYKIENASREIAKGMKWIIEWIEKYTIKRINAAAKQTYFLLFPELRSNLKEIIATVNDSIACLFRRIIGNLLRIIGQFLLTIINRFINAPLCAIENMVGALIGKLTGLINSALSAIMAPLNNLFGFVDIAGDIIGIVQDLLSFLTCEEEPECPGVREWNIWDGPQTTPLPDLGGLLDRIRTFASSTAQIVDPNTFDFNLDFSDIFQDNCNVDAIFCGPPRVEFYGGGGSGASGNAIVSATGDILGVDLTSFGSGYTSSPTVNFIDSCGTGRGARGRGIVGSGGTGGTPVTAGGTGGTPVTAGGLPVNAGGTGGTPVTVGGTPVTAGGTPVTAGGTGGTPVTAGGIGGTPVTAGRTPVTVGGTGGTPVTTGGTAVTAGGTGGTPVTAGGLQVNVGGTGGTPVTSGGIPVTSGGTPVTAGGTGGTPVTSGGTGGTPVTVGGTPVTSGGTGGTPLTAGGTGAGATGGGTPVIAGGTGGTPVTVGGTPVTVGGTGGTPVTSGGIPVTSGGTPVTVGGTGGIPVNAGGTGGTPVTAGGLPVNAGGTGGTPVTSNGIPLTSNGIPLTSGGTPVTSGGTPVTSGGGIPVTAGGIPLTAGGTGSGQIIAVIIDKPGFGYLPDFDGSRGGDGRVWARPDQITIKRKDGTYDTPYDPGEVFEVFDGDIVTGPFTKQDVRKSLLPSTNFGQYIVSLKICNTAIVSAGINYSPDDKIIVEPANGAVLKPKFGVAGELLKIDIIDSGSGFEEMPKIYIRSETGYNAEILPILCVNRIGDIPESEYSIPFGEKIIKVVDCVGKF